MVFETPVTTEPQDAAAYDVAVIGGGIAAMSAAVFLGRAGLKVVCVEIEPYPHHKVGESLDWSSPWLFAQLGVAPEGLIADGVATHKNHIVVTEVGKAPWEAAPWAFLKRSPIRFETSTLHVDRTALDQRIYERAAALGAESRRRGRASASSCRPTR